MRILEQPTYQLEPRPNPPAWWVKVQTKKQAEQERQAIIGEAVALRATRWEQ